MKQFFYISWLTTDLSTEQFFDKTLEIFRVASQYYTERDKLNEIQENLLFTFFLMLSR